MKQIDKLFDKMDEWRHFPAYQLERRADIFFSIYLGDVLLSKYGEEFERLVPEFPVRVGTIQWKANTNQSFKIDYLAKAKKGNKVVLVELKTDDSSRRSKQDWYLSRAKDVGLVALLEGLKRIYAATKSKKKYRHLLEQLQHMGLIKLGTDGKVEIIQTQYDVQIVYVQPNKEDHREDVISFHEVARIVEKHGDELSMRFARSLRSWADIKAGDGLKP